MRSWLSWCGRGPSGGPAPASEPAGQQVEPEFRPSFVSTPEPPLPKLDSRRRAYMLRRALTFRLRRTLSRAPGQVGTRPRDRLGIFRTESTTMAVVVKPRLCLNCFTLKQGESTRLLVQERARAHDRSTTTGAVVVKPQLCLTGCTFEQGESTRLLVLVKLKLCF